MTKTDISTETLLALRDLAEEATPGPWRRLPRRSLIVSMASEGKPLVCDVKKTADAAHIIASAPDVVIATIHELLRLREENERLEKELGSARNWATSQHEVAKMAWGGEIPSPLPGHTHMTEEEACAMFEHLNCPWCGGSGHVGDCEEADQQVKAKLERLEKEADWLAQSAANAGWDGRRVSLKDMREAARRAVEEVCPKN